MKNVYLDHHATTPVDPRVLDVMLPYLRDQFGNPSSVTHPHGLNAKEAVEKARTQVASAFGTNARSVVFTSGATEANNLALLGVAERAPSGRDRRDHFITQASEHHAVLEPLEQLEKRGFRRTVLRPDSDGFVSSEQVANALTDRTLLVSIMAAQNEVGAVQPIESIGAVCREAGVIFHTDAAQAAGKIPVDVERMNVDLLSVSAHKYYGPKGVGCLCVRRRGQPRIRLSPLAFGGGQEGGIRPGTLNVPGIVGLGECSRLLTEELPDEMSRLANLRNRLWDAVSSRLPEVRLNGPRDWERRLPGNLSLSFPGIDGAALLIGLQDIAASSGSACTAGNAEPSYVLKAMGLPDDLAASTLRLCVGRFNTEEEIDYAAGRIVETVGKLRRQRR